MGWGIFSPRIIKRHYAVIPMICLTTFGMAMAGAYLIRLAIYSPEVSWARHSNPEPWNYYDKKQYKFLNPIGRNYAEGPDRPNYLLKEDSSK